MRIISGSARGRKLISPKDKDIRPTEDRVKESVFNLLHGPFYDVFVLDLFSGSGGIGIEFLSRGAGMVWFNDVSKKNIETTRANVEMVKLKEQTKILQMDFEKCLEEAKRKDIRFDYIYLDPPYAKIEFYNKAMEKIQEYNLLAEEGKIIVEAPKEYEFDFGSAYSLWKEKSYGTTGIWIYQNNEESS